MSSPSPRRPWPIRLARAIAWVVLTLVVLLTARMLYVFRDRFPGYRVELALPRQEPAAGTPLRAGFGRVDITPPIGDPAHPVWMAGFSNGRAATNVHDPLQAVALVVDNGRVRLGIVALDAIGFFHDDVIRVRERVPADWKLDYVVVCSTHSHSTPDLMGLWGPDVLHSGVDPQYKERVIEGAKKALGDAVVALRPARLALHEIKVDPTGLVADTRKPVVFDPDLRVMLFTEAEGPGVIGSLVGWANHPETPWSGNQELTADFPGVIRTALEKGIIYDGQVKMPGLGGTHLFVNGAVGGLMTTHPSITVRDPFLERDFKEPSHDKTRAVGHQLVKRILERVRAGEVPSASSVPISIHARTLELKLANRGFMVAGLLGLLERGHSHWMQMRSEVAFLTIGDASIACIPGEIYPEIVNGGIVRAPGGDYDIEPLEIPPVRDLMPGRVKFLFGLANDEIGYIIPKSEWDQKPPYLYGAKGAPYGEVNSVGPETAFQLHQAIRALIDEEQTSPR